uniref:F-box domain-containing protein n=1 Tax=Psilocybe cubensis TaxID=181762 RepID=A0A8H7YBE1_PSICU
MSLQRSMPEVPIEQICSISNSFQATRKEPLVLVPCLVAHEPQLIEPLEIESTSHAPITLQSLPIEILLHIFSFFELKPYIISHGVCKDWQHLLPLTELHPIRRRMLELYHSIISTPNHEMTRPWTLENMQPFDRQTYINTLLAQYPVIPAEFQMWILEWPNCLAIACTWPSLPVFISRSDGCQRRPGINWFGYAPTCPHLSAVVYKSGTPDVKVIPALLIWREHVITDWLVFDQDEPDLFGRVYVTDYMEDETSAVIPYSGEDPWRINEPYSDWIAYMEYLWGCTISALEQNPLYQLSDDPLILPKIGLIRNQHPYVINGLGAKSGQNPARKKNQKLC